LFSVDVVAGAAVTGRAGQRHALGMLKRSNFAVVTERQNFAPARSFKRPADRGGIHAHADFGMQLDQLALPAIALLPGGSAAARLRRLRCGCGQPTDC
jgi:hypothetical protein